MRIGDVSRRRRLIDPVRIRWYARQRALRFARRMLLGCEIHLSPVGSAQPCESIPTCCDPLTADN